jgi:RNA polymerase sigma-70 factor, ECF subfamily
VATASIPGSRYSMATDEQLILDFQQGSHEAFNELFLRYRDFVWAYFRRRIVSSAQAEELTQEAFLAVIRAKQRYEPRSTFRSYIFGIAFRLLLAHRRRLASEQLVVAVEPDSVECSSSPDPGANLLVREAVQKLEESEREILMLREFEELSYDEIAGILRIPVNTVRSRLFRARTALKSILAARAAIREARQ